MTAKDILYTTQARLQMGNGLNALADAVKVTLGPRGRNVALDSSWGPPVVTKDGATVAKDIGFESRVANMGAQMVKEVAAQTATVAGDGTTTAIVIAQAIYAEGIKLITAGVDPMALKRGIEHAVQAVLAELKGMAQPVRGREEIEQIGHISANGDRAIGAMIAEAMEKVGRNGVITLEEGNSMETTLDVTAGVRFDRGYLSPYFITDVARMRVELDDAYVLVHEGRISNLKSLLPLLEKVVQAQKPLLVIADVDDEALTGLVVNKLRGTLQVCAVKPPSFGDARALIMEDIAILVGAKVVSSQLGMKLENVGLDGLGHVRRVIAEKDNTTLIDGAGDAAMIEARAKQLQTELEGVELEHARTTLRGRIATLVGGIAVIKVGGITETEMKEKKARVEDAVHATQAAVAEGVVPGGGVALLRALPCLDGLKLQDDEQYGVAVVRRALQEPLRQIAKNSGVDGAVVVDRVSKAEGASGYNAATDTYEDLVRAGVIDPAKVVRVALENAASVASLLLTADVAIAEHTERQISTRTNIPA